MPLTTTPCFPEAGRKELGYEQKEAYSVAEAVRGREVRLQATARPQEHVKNLTFIPKATWRVQGKEKRDMILFAILKRNHAGYWPLESAFICL